MYQAVSSQLDKIFSSILDSFSRFSFPFGITLYINVTISYNDVNQAGLEEWRMNFQSIDWVSKKKRKFSLMPFLALLSSWLNIIKALWCTNMDDYQSIYWIPWLTKLLKWTDLGNVSDVWAYKMFHRASDWTGAVDYNPSTYGFQGMSKSTWGFQACLVHL